MSRHLDAFIQCGAFLLWLVVACMFLMQRERQDSGRKLNNIPVHYRSCQQQQVAILRGFFRFEVLLEAFCLVQRRVWDLPCSPRNSPSTVCNRRTISGIRTRPSAVVPLRALRKSFPLTGLNDLWTENPPQDVPERLTKQCLSGGSCRLRAPTAHWFLGTLSERNRKLHVDEDKLGAGMESFHEPRDRLY